LRIISHNEKSFILSEVMLLYGTNADYGLKTQAWRLNLMRQCKQVDKLAGHKTKQRHRWRLHVS